MFFKKSRIMGLIVTTCLILLPLVKAGAANIDLEVPLAGIAANPGGITQVGTFDATDRPITMQLYPSAILAIDIGEQIQLRTFAELQNGQTIDVSTNSYTYYASSNPIIATVSFSGAVQIVDYGKTSIFVEYLGEQGQIPVLALAGTITSLEPVFNLRQLGYDDPEQNPEHSIALAPGQSTQLDILASLSDGTVGVITGNASTSYLSDSPGVASIDLAGRISAISDGIAHITASSHGVSTTTVVTVTGLDITPPQTTLTFNGPVFISSDNTFISTNTLVQLPAIDPTVSGAYTSGVTFTGLLVDQSAPVTPLFLDTYFAPISISSEGYHNLIYASVDATCNNELFHSVGFYVDATVPITQLLVNGFEPSTTSLILISTDVLSLSAFDADSGVAETLYSIDGSTEGVYVSVLKLATGSHELAFRSFDHVGNVETTQNVSVTVFAGAESTTTIASWGQVNSLPERLQSIAAVGAQGRVYAVGGVASDYSYSNRVYAAAANPDGSLGAWQAMTPLPGAMGIGGAFARAGKIYVVGNGQSLTSNILPDGTLSGWMPTASVGTFSNTQRAVEAVGNFVYAIGGNREIVNGNSRSNRVSRATILADGSLSSWTDVTPLPFAVTRHATAVRGNRIYVIGGETASGFSNTVLFADVLADGSITNWSQTSSYPSSIFEEGAELMGSSLHIVGGSVGNPTTTAVRAGDIQLDLTISAWRDEAPLPQVRSMAGTAVVNGHIYVLGGSKHGLGSTLNPTNTVFASDAPTTSITSTTISSWGPANSLPERLQSAATVGSLGRLYAIGGIASDYSYSNRVYAAVANQDGSLGEWQAMTPLPIGMGIGGAFARAGKIYVVGNGQSLTSNILPDGTLSGWTPTASVGTFSNTQRAVEAVDDFVYAIGGNREIVNGNSRSNRVSRATILADGSLSPWLDIAPLPYAVSRHATAVRGNRLYVIGGVTAAGFPNTVLFADVLPDGSIANWSQTTSYPSSIFEEGIEVMGNSLHIIGGSVGNPTTTAVRAGDIQLDLTISAWRDEAPLPQVRSMAGTAVLNGHIYVVGGSKNGFSSTLDPIDTVFVSNSLVNHVSSIDGVVTLDSVASGMQIVEVSSNSPNAALALATASAQGLILVSGVYDIKPVTFFNPPALINFSFDPSVISDTSTLHLYRFDGLSWSSSPASGITNQSVIIGTSSSVSANITYTSLWGLFIKGKVEDNLAPRTSLSVGTPIFIASTTLYATDKTSFSLSSIDDLATVGDEAGLGMARTFVAVDANPFTVYSGSFQISGQGSHAIQFYSVDMASNTETVQHAQVTIDTTSPSLALAPADGAMLDAPTPSIIASYLDAGAGVSASSIQLSLDGMDVTTVSTVTASSVTFLPAAALSQGTHTVTAMVSDQLGNQASAASTFLLDSIPPDTTLLVNGLQTSATNVTLISTDTLGFAAVDSGSGVSQTLYSLDGSTEQIYISTFSLAAGTHTLAYHSVDNMGNVEAAKSISLDVLGYDVTPPTIMVTPVDQSTITIETPGIIATYSDSGRGVDSASVRLALDNVDITTQSIMTASSATFTPLGALAQGRHAISISVSDYAGNTASAMNAFYIDSILPFTTLVIGVPQFSTGTAVYMTSTTLLGFTTSKCGQISYSIDSGSFTVFFASFTISSEGPHLIRYFSTDTSGNIEIVRSSTMTVDITPPVTQLSVDGIPVSSTSSAVISTDTIGFSVSDLGSGVAVTLYSIDGSTEQVYVSDFSLPEGAHNVVYRSRDHLGNLENAKPFLALVRGPDATPPSLTLNPVNESTATTAMPLITTVYIDTGTGVDLASVHLALDNVDITTISVLAASSITYIPATNLAQGPHTVAASVSDYVGNAAAGSSTFLIDSLAPVTTLLIDGSAVSAGSVTATSTDVFSFSAFDGGTGVLDTRYSIDSGAEQLFTTGFTLPVGFHILAFHSRDQVDNTEPLNTRYITVLATTAPSAMTVRLDYPRPQALAVERAVGNIVDVRGEASGENLQSWTLSVAVGSDAVTGFLPLVSGNTNILGHLAGWDTRKLSGYYTLKLSATDSYGNTALSLAPAFVGRPVMNFAMGRRNANVVLRDLKDLQGIVVRPDNLIWVSADQGDRLLLLTSTGAVVASIGSHKPGPFKFKNPRGLSLDEENNLYVADRDNDRVAKLSPDGSQLLAEFKLGLKDPNDAAVDADGSVYVADTGHRRIRVFGPGGNVLRDIALDQGKPESKPWGVALSSTGLWVSDLTRKAIYLYTRTGILLKTIPGAGKIRGASVDHAQALYAADRNNDEIDKYDPQGSPLLSFGPRKWLGEWDCPGMKFWHNSYLCTWFKPPWPKEWEPGSGYWLAYLSDPLDAAIGPDGSLWVVDAGHDRIARYGLPDIIASSGKGYKTMDVQEEPGAQEADKSPVSRVIDPQDGGKVEQDNGTGVSVPGGALSSALEITVQAANTGNDAEPKRRSRLANRIAGVSDEVEYGPEGTAFNIPVTLALHYDTGRIALQNINEDELKVYYWNASKGDWEALDSIVDKESKIVSCQAGHFSVYQVMGPGIDLGDVGQTATADAAFMFRDLYAFPNPAARKRPTIRIQVGVADSVDIHIYDVSGQMAHSVSLTSPPRILDDNNGKGPQYTYDYVWDTSNIGSGVYIYAVTARKGGQADIRRVKKLAVIK